MFRLCGLPAVSEKRGGKLMSAHDAAVGGRADVMANWLAHEGEKIFF